MLTLVGTLVVFLLIGPLVLIAIAGVLLLAAAFVGDGSQRTRATVRCPVTGNRVTADFLVPVGDTHPSEVISCSAYSPPRRVACKKACRDVTEVRWGARFGMFPRWALTANGPVTCDSAAGGAGGRSRRGSGQMKATALPTALLAILLAGGAPARGADDLLQRAQAAFKPIPATPPALPGNPANPAKVELGKMLFFEPRLSSSGLLACSTCHNLGLGGVDLEETSIGHGWQKGPRNAPTVLNAVFNVAQFWDGRAANLKEQAKGPVQATVEMNSNPERLVRTLESLPEYVARFGQAFPGEPDPVTFENTAKAIEVFEATLLTPDSRFDRYLGGDRAALVAAEQKGLQIFMEKGCVGCHFGVAAGGAAYFPFGIVERPGADILPPEDKGRFAVTRTVTDEYVFKAPSLRNVALTPPYFHSGRVWSLKQAVGIMGAAQLGIGLNEEETEAVVAFLGALTGAQPRVEYPILPPSTEATPRPWTAPTPIKGP